MPLRAKIETALAELSGARDMTKQCSLVLRGGKEYNFWRGQFESERTVLMITLLNGQAVAIAVSEVVALHLPTNAPQAGSRGRQI